MVLGSLVKCLFTSCLDYKSPWIHGLLQVSPPLPSLPDSPIFHISVGLSWGGGVRSKRLLAGSLPHPSRVAWNHTLGPSGTLCGLRTFGIRPQPALFIGEGLTEAPAQAPSSDGRGPGFFLHHPCQALPSPQPIEEPLSLQGGAGAPKVPPLSRHGLFSGPPHPGPHIRGSASPLPQPQALRPTANSQFSTQTSCKPLPRNPPCPWALPLGCSIFPPGRPTSSLIHTGVQLPEFSSLRAPPSFNSSLSARKCDHFLFPSPEKPSAPQPVRPRWAWSGHSALRAAVCRVQQRVNLE